MNPSELSTVATVVLWLVGLGLSGLLLALCILEGMPRHTPDNRRRFTHKVTIPGWRYVDGKRVQKEQVDA